jgi:hypothetical protein
MYIYMCVCARAVWLFPEATYNRKCQQNRTRLYSAVFLRMRTKPRQEVCGGCLQAVSFIVSPRTAVLWRRKPASAGISLDSWGALGNDKRHAASEQSKKASAWGGDLVFNRWHCCIFESWKVVPATPGRCRGKQRYSSTQSLLLN